MLIDEVEIILKAGNGGNGKAAFFPKPMRGPSGGNGGKGGDVYLMAIKDNDALAKFSGKKKHKAEDGANGGSNRRTGKNGKDLFLTIPLGTTIIDLDTKTEFEPKIINEPFIISRGGLGGKGNWEFRSPTNTTPTNFQPGFPGEKKRLKLVLRLMANFGLIGLPNAGKSSLLNELTNAHVKTANYPFTTLEPNLGIFKGKIIADNPGLLTGASMGRGLGIKFLKHIEKCHLLLHCISSDSMDVLGDYEIIRKEVKQFKSELLLKQEIILLTKSDLIPKKELLKKINKLKTTGKEILAVSIYDFEAIEKLKTILSNN